MFAKIFQRLIVKSSLVCALFLLPCLIPSHIYTFCFMEVTVVVKHSRTAECCRGSLSTFDEDKSTSASHAWGSEQMFNKYTSQPLQIYWKGTKAQILIWKDTVCMDAEAQSSNLKTGWVIIYNIKSCKNEWHCSFFSNTMLRWENLHSGFYMDTWPPTYFRNISPKHFAVHTQPLQADTWRVVAMWKVMCSLKTRRTQQSSFYI